MKRLAVAISAGVLAAIGTGLLVCLLVISVPIIGVVVALAVYSDMHEVPETTPAHGWMGRGEGGAL